MEMLLEVIKDPLNRKKERYTCRPIESTRDVDFFKKRLEHNLREFFTKRGQSKEPLASLELPERFGELYAQIPELSRIFKPMLNDIFLKLGQSYNVVEIKFHIPANTIEVCLIRPLPDSESLPEFPAMVLNQQESDEAGLIN